MSRISYKQKTLEAAAILDQFDAIVEDYHESVAYRIDVQDLPVTNALDDIRDQAKQYLRELKESMGVDDLFAVS